jgi:hypothetical protein
VSIFVLDSNIVSFYIRQNQKIIQKVHNELASENEVLIDPIAYTDHFMNIAGLLFTDWA